MFIEFAGRHVNSDHIVSVRKENLSIFVETKLHVSINTYETESDATWALSDLLFRLGGTYYDANNTNLRKS